MNKKFDYLKLNGAQMKLFKYYGEMSQSPVGWTDQQFSEMYNLLQFIEETSNPEPQDQGSRQHAVIVMGYHWLKHLAPQYKKFYN